MFKKTVSSRYKIVSYDNLVTKLVDEAKEEVSLIEKELKNAQEDFDRHLAANAPYPQLRKLEKKIEDLENDRDDATRKYEKARRTTLEDLKAEQRYQDWKDSR